MAVEDMVLQDKVEVVDNPRVTARRRRNEWPSLDTALLHQMQQPPPTITPQVVAQAKAVIDEAITKCDMMDPCNEDRPIFEEYTWIQVGEPDIGEVLKVLYWRCQEQSVILDVWDSLILQGFVSPLNVQLPMAMMETSKQVSNLSWLLGCFEGPFRKPKVPLLADSFETPVVWLAAMIIRGCSNIEKLMDISELSKFVGPVNETAYAEYLQFCDSKTFTCNPQELLGRDDEPSLFGFWLPHGTNARNEEELAQRIRMGVQFFNRVEAAYKAWFRLSDNDLLCEEQ